MECDSGHGLGIESFLVYRQKTGRLMFGEGRRADLRHHVVGEMGS